MEKYYKVNDVKDVIKKLAKEPAYQHTGESFYNGVCAVEGALMCLETVMIEELKVGKWLNEDFPDKPVTQLTMAVCSVCNGCAYRTDHGYTILSKYCPYCGAKMKENIGE